MSVTYRNRKEGVVLEPLHSAENVLRILFVWHASGQKSLGLTEISRITGINKSTVYRILLSLQKYHMVALNPTTKKYEIDYGVLTLSTAFIRQTDLRTVAHPLIEELAVRSGNTITLALRKQDHLVFIDRVDGCENVRFYCDIGKIAHFNSGAAAKAVFANLREEERQQICHQDAKRHTVYTKTWGELMRQVPEIRENGYSISDEEVDPGVFAVGAPIFDHQGEVIAGMAMATLKIHLTEEDIHNMIRQTVATSKAISARMGWI